MRKLSVDVLVNVVQRLSFKDWLNSRLVCMCFNDGWKCVAKTHINQPILHEKDVVFKKIKWFMTMLEYGIVGTPSQQLWMLEAVLRKCNDGLNSHWAQMIKSYFQLSTAMYNICIRVMQDQSVKRQHRLAAEFMKCLYYNGVELPAFLPSEFMTRHVTEIADGFGNMDKEECEALLKAANMGDVNEIHSVIQRKRKNRGFNDMEKRFADELISAVQKKEFGIVANLLSFCPGMDVNNVIQYSVISKKEALWNERYQMMDLLLKQPGCDVNKCKDQDNDKTALMLACMRQDIEMVTFLLQSEIINVNKADQFGYTALIQVCRSFFETTDILELLLKHPQIDVSKRNDYGCTAFHFACDNRNLLVATILLRYSEAVLNEKVDGTSGWTGLRLALECEDWCEEEDDDFDLEGIALCRFLFSHHQIDIAGSFEGISVIPYAAQYFTSRVMKLLLHQGLFDVNEADETGMTGLMWAVEKNNIGSLTHLLNQPEIDVNSVNESCGSTALILAVKYGNRGKLDECGGHRDVDIVELLLQHPDIDVNETNNYSNTALMVAVQNGDKSIVELLLQRPDIDVNQENSTKETPLLMAVKNWDKLADECFIDDLDIEGDEEDTEAVQMAGKRQRTEILKLLLQHSGIVVNQKNLNNETALMLASQLGHTDVCKLLGGHPGVMDIKEE